jgi:hypothetical protein
MLQWMKKDSNELKWARWADLESMFNMQCTMPRENMLQYFLQTWEAMEDGRILRWVHGQKILIDHVLIHEQLGISKEGTIDVANATTTRRCGPSSPCISLRFEWTRTD